MNQTVYFENISGKRIFCCSTEPVSTQKKIVIMSHGFRGSSIGPARQFVDFGRILVKEGYSVLRFDQPNGGNSEGEYIDSSFNEWVDTIVYFATKYLSLGYQVSLFGQSMGATATVVATSNPNLIEKIPCILLWVPDAKETIVINSKEIYEEGGQKYRGSFWQEAKDSNFFKCLENYNGNIHLVYGETDKYVDENLKSKTIQIVRNKQQPVTIFKGQDHSPWEYDLALTVYKDEVTLLNKNTT